MSKRGVTATETEACWFADYGSHKAGLLDLKFYIGLTSLGDLVATGPNVHHNFLGIWQELHDVTLAVDETGAALHCTRAIRASSRIPISPAAMACR